MKTCVIKNYLDLLEIERVEKIQVVNNNPTFTN